jgi:hypothetical protein
MRISIFVILLFEITIIVKNKRHTQKLNQN